MKKLIKRWLKVREMKTLAMIIDANSADPELVQLALKRLKLLIKE